LPLTLLVATVTLLGSVPLAMLWAWGRHRGAQPIRWLCTACIETLRGAPLVMWLFMAAFMLPALWGPTVDIGLLPRVLMVTVPFSAAYMAEIFRGALAAVQPAQEEAARTLGAHAGQVLWHVVMPQAWRVALPSLTSHSIGVLKDTALISVVGLHELQGSLGLSLNGDADCGPSSWRPTWPWARSTWAWAWRCQPWGGAWRRGMRPWPAATDSLRPMKKGSLPPAQ